MSKMRIGLDMQISHGTRPLCTFWPSLVDLTHRSGQYTLPTSLTLNFPHTVGYISTTFSASGAVKWAYNYYTVLPLKRFCPSIANFCHMATCLYAYALGPSLVATCARSPHTCI